MDFGKHHWIYIYMLVHVMILIEGRDNEERPGMRTEDLKAYIIELEPERKQVEINKPFGNEGIINSDSGLKSESGKEPSNNIQGGVINKPIKLETIQKTENIILFPGLKLILFRIQIEEQDFSRSNPIGYYRTGDNLFKYYVKQNDLTHNSATNKRSTGTSMTGYVGDTSKVEQQLTMAAGLVSEEYTLPESLISRLYTLRKQNYLMGSMKKSTVYKLDGVGGSQRLSKQHSSLINAGNLSGKNIGDDDLKYDNVRQGRDINLSGILSKSDISLGSRGQAIHSSPDGSSSDERIRSKRAEEKLSRLLTHVDVPVSTSRAKRASIDLDNLFPPVSLTIGRLVRSANSEKSARNGNGDTNDEEMTRSRRVVDHEFPRAFGLVDVNVSKGRSKQKRASIDLNNLLPDVSLDVGKSELEAARSADVAEEESARPKRASVDLSGILPSTDLQVGQPKRLVHEPKEISPSMFLISGTTLTKTSIDVPNLIYMIRSPLKKLAGEK